jgi:folate-binding protein YgfZ
MTAVTIDNRSFILISGEDAEDFLQGIITTDLTLVPTGACWPGALLTPQGKILFEFMIGRAETGFVIETAAVDTDGLIRRLTLYRLRAKVSFERLAHECVTVRWGDDQAAAGLADQRFARAGIALFRMPGSGGTDPASLYDALRFDNGISGAGEDSPLNDYFPHDLLMDSNGGLSFKKGCYIGQEVVSRMQHRATARRRLVSVVSAAAPLGEAGSAITAGERDVGALIAAGAAAGLAVVRIDKVGAAIKAGLPLMIGGQAVNLRLPTWSGLEFPDETDEAAS